MKSVIFFRHGKSDWEAGVEADHERPLARRGRKAARFMGRLLADRGEVPESVVTSSALRAQQSAARAGKAGRWEAPVRVAEALYLAEPAAVLEELRAEPDATGLLLVVGHEPSWSDTIAGLIGGGRVRLPTAAMARVDLDVERWQDVAFGTGQLAWLLPPRLFM